MGEARPGVDEGRGVVGDRHLVALQTFDIARLTTHAVPLVPETFIAVSGMGPREDSNGSGKTSFLIAVSVLLADPQWRFESSGGRYASGILFKPDAAGVDWAQQASAAPHGYVVGVFAEPDNAAASAMTVWVRIATTAPYVQAKWVRGLHVADGATHAERTQQADALWRELGSGVVSARRMAEELYGNAPRCLTYLDTALRPAVPSLLSQQLSEMGPEAIGASLIALSGMTELLEQEEARRGQALERRVRMEQVRKENEEADASDENVLSGVRARDTARLALQEGQSLWRRYVAACYVRAVESDRALVSKSAELRKTAAQCRVSAETAKDTLRTLRAANDLAEATGAARQIWADAQELLRQAERQRTQLETRKDELKAQRRKLLPRADGWQGTTVEEAQQQLEAARGEKFTADRDVRDAKGAVEAARRLLAEVERGRGGQAGEAIAVLELAGISAVGLLDQLRLAKGARAVWEPRLSPWREAVVVGAEQADEALRALHSLPGALVVEADPVGAETAGFDGVTSDLPLTRFLTALEQRLVALSSPSGARDDRLSLTVVGGFTDPLAGRALRLQHARKALEAREGDAATARGIVRAKQAALVLAESEHRAAAAMQQLAELQEREEELDAQLATAIETMGAAHSDVVAKFAVYEKARDLAAIHEEKVKTAALQARAAAEAVQEADAAVTALDRDRGRLQVDAWQSLWRGSFEDASAALAVQEGRPPRPAMLHRTAEGQLRIAYERYGLRDGQLADAHEDLLQGLELCRDLAEEDPTTLPTVGFEEAAAPLQIRLDGQADMDRVAAARIEAERALRQSAWDELVEGVDKSAHQLTTLQDMIEQHLDGLFKQIDQAFNQLDLQRTGGHGAELDVRSVRPDGARPWRWEVTPRWKRSPHSRYISYRENANSAQVKVYAVQLVLAALLADSETQGRVLILDELGNSLGENNRKDMLASLRDVAARRHITILGTCQDSVLTDAADVCDELLWFTHASASDVYNQPTRAWAYDPDTGRVELTADWLTAGRPHV
ncbi:hypothetical protein [Streptomyces sp. NPDC048644]|uniref:hypothetical protein n=1 Tax=Streptomyces sp. NPDC048644 TaxID=3365582 RepID=UPI0037217B5C